jgi:hypothetical protein
MLVTGALKIDFCGLHLRRMDLRARLHYIRKRRAPPL